METFYQYIEKPLDLRALHTKLLTIHSNNCVPLSSVKNYSATFEKFQNLDLKILLVEDVLVNQIVALSMIEPWGVTVDIAEDGLQAIKMWTDNQYDLILMDCLMPKMNGYDATKKIRERETILNTHIPIIALTANAMEDSEGFCRSIGMDDFLSKPFRKRDLYNILKVWGKPTKSTLKFR